jgi:DNA repair exonuclease SbcCD ATPase subunit
MELDGKSVEATGTNGTGKTSIIDAIRFALTNNSDRDYIIKNGESEGEIYIETDTGLAINRRKRAEQSDYKSIKENGKEKGIVIDFVNGYNDHCHCLVSLKNELIL